MLCSFAPSWGTKAEARPLSGTGPLGVFGRVRAAAGGPRRPSRYQGATMSVSLSSHSALCAPGDFQSTTFDDSPV
jgi:hypothetical protein